MSQKRGLVKSVYALGLLTICDLEQDMNVHISKKYVTVLAQSQMVCEKLCPDMSHYGYQSFIAGVDGSCVVSYFASSTPLPPESCRSCANLEPLVTIKHL